MNYYTLVPWPPTRGRGCQFRPLHSHHNPNIFFLKCTTSLHSWRRVTPSPTTTTSGPWLWGSTASLTTTRSSTPSCASTRTRYICISSSTDISIHTSVFINWCIYTHIYLHQLMYTHTHTSSLTTTRSSTPSCASTYKCVCVCVCVYRAANSSPRTLMPWPISPMPRSGPVMERWLARNSQKSLTEKKGEKGGKSLSLLPRSGPVMERWLARNSQKSSA